jgi:hypothetical protein
MLTGVMAAPAQTIEFPIHANDLKPGERIVTVVHATGGGPQTGAKDLRILRRVADNNWQVLKDGQTNDAINSNYLIYKRPVYAMAGGTVIGILPGTSRTEGSPHLTVAIATGLGELRNAPLHRLSRCYGRHGRHDS